jgi:hypothetical protein
MDIPINNRGNFMELEKIVNKNGEIFNLISKGESLNIFKEFDESVETRTFLKLIEKDFDILNLLTNHKTNMSIIEGLNFPMLFSIDINAQSDFKRHFNELAEINIAKTDQELKQLFKKVFPEVLEKISSNLPTKTKANLLVQTRKGNLLKSLPKVMGGLKPEAKEELLKEGISSIAGEIIPTILSFIDTSKSWFINSGLEIRQNIINASNIDEREYEEMINKLENRYNVIDSFISIYWCEKEHDPVSFYTIGSHMKGKCPICENDLLKCTLYHFKPNIVKLLRADEGLIKCLAMFLVDESGLSWLPDVYLQGINKDTEKDIVIESGDNTYTLIEVKNYAKDVTPRGKKTNIDKMMSKTLNHLRKYEEKDINVEKVYSVFNYCYDKSLQAQVKRNLKSPKFSDLNLVEFNVIGINTLKNMEFETETDLIEETAQITRTDRQIIN